MKRFINVLLHYITNVKHRKHVYGTNRKGIEGKEGTRGTRQSRKFWTFRISECGSKRIEHRRSRQDSKQLCKQDTEGKKCSGSYWQAWTQKQKVISGQVLSSFLSFFSYIKTIATRLTITLMFIDMLDSHPSFAIPMLKMIYHTWRDAEVVR